MQNVTATNVTLHVGSPTGDTIEISPITADTGNTYGLSPSIALSSFQTYYVVLSSGITDKFGTPLPETAFSFTTGDTSSPTVSLLDPFNNATGVRLTQSITIQFNKPVLGITTDGDNVTLRAGSVTGTIIPILISGPDSSQTYTINPQSPLSDVTTYYLVLSSNITDSNGNPLQQTSFQFLTSSKLYYVNVLNSTSTSVYRCTKPVNGSGNAMENCVSNSGSQLYDYASISTARPASGKFLYNSLSSLIIAYPVTSNGIATYTNSFSTYSAPINQKVGKFVFSPDGRHIYIKIVSTANPPVALSIVKCDVNSSTGLFSNCASAYTFPASQAYNGTIQLNSNGTFMYITGNSSTGADTNYVCPVNSANGNIGACVSSGLPQNSNALGGMSFNGSFVFNSALATTSTQKQVITLCNANPDGTLSGCSLSYPTYTRTPSVAPQVAAESNLLYVADRANRLSVCTYQIPLLSGCAQALGSPEQPAIDIFIYNNN